MIILIFRKDDHMIAKLNKQSASIKTVHCPTTPGQQADLY